jgi:hypothetical protein
LGTSWELALARRRLGEAPKRSQGSGANELPEQGVAALAAQLGDAHPQVRRARHVVALPWLDRECSRDRGPRRHRPVLMPRYLVWRKKPPPT